MIAPEMPTGGAVRQTVIDDQSDGKFDDGIRVIGFEWSDRGRIDAEVFFTFTAVVVGKSQVDFDGTIGIAIAEVSE